MNKLYTRVKESLLYAIAAVQFTIEAVREKIDREVAAHEAFEAEVKRQHEEWLEQAIQSLPADQQGTFIAEYNARHKVNKGN